MTVLAAESRRRVAADLESEGTCCHSEEQVCGSQCPNDLLFLDHSKHVGIFPCSLFSSLH